MLNETSIQCFLSLAETLSFTESARRLFLTQQAVSKNILRLESDVGFPLVDRTGKNVVLTPAGERCVEMFRSWQKEYTHVLAEIRHSMGTDHQSVTIGYQNNLDFGVGIVQADEAMRSAFPETSFRVERHSPGALTQKMFSNALDIIVMYGRYAPTNPDYRKEALFDVYINVMVSADHPLMSEEATYLDFKDQPYILDVFEGETEKVIEARANREISLCGLSPSAIITVPNRESAYMMAEMSGGIILGSDISQTSGARTLMRYRTGGKDKICCLWKKGAGPIVEQYVKTLIKEYQ